uniref:Solute-binding protein family 5 domain-containing protein n=1 Tax=Panagrolaimus superbus TaxID=310955 RepID=A0A914Z9D7_9BILA
MKLKSILLSTALAAAVMLPGTVWAKSLTVAIPNNLTGLDPTNINDTLSQTSIRLIYQGLFGFDKDMKLVPLLAESYEANDNATEFTIKLREGVKFHDGTDFNAAAVKTNIDRLANPDNKLSPDPQRAFRCDDPVSCPSGCDDDFACRSGKIRQRH